MDFAKPVFWHEGLFLRPQHFQRQELYYQKQLKQIAGLQNPYGWGVISTSINNFRLTSFIFELESADLIFQDGTIVNYPHDSVLESRSFESAWTPGSPSLSVFVGLRNLDLRGGNLSGSPLYGSEVEAEKYKKKRFMVEESELLTSDLFCKDSQDEISYLKYDLQLFFGEEAENASNYHLIKIAEISRSGNEISLSTDYIPPLLNLKSSPLFEKTVTSLNEKLRIKQGELIRWYRGSRKVDMVMDKSSDHMIPVLQTLSRYIPQLQNYIQYGKVSPFQVHQTLLQLVGELSIYSDETDYSVSSSNRAPDPVIREYMHENLHGCINWAIRQIDALLVDLFEQPDFSEVLHFDGTYYSSMLSTRMLSGKNQYYLAISSAISTDLLISLIESKSKLSSREVVPLLLARSLAGVKLTFDPAPPAAMKRYANTVYFLLDADGDAWDAIRENTNIALFCEKVPDDLSAKIVILGNK